jgi:hypothetical protein
MIVGMLGAGIQDDMIVKISGVSWEELKSIKSSV